MAQRGAQGIGDAFSSSFQGIITGTQTAQEALASFFQNIAKSFLDMATEIIAQMVIMYAFKQLLGLFGGGQALHHPTFQRRIYRHHCIIQPVIVWHGATPRPRRWRPGIQRADLHGGRAWPGAVCTRPQWHHRR
jgi:hypothetical protein